jgi:plasmid stabilization system protein ParE
LVRRYAIRRKRSVIQDLVIIRRYLIRVYRDLGETKMDAETRAGARLRGAAVYMQSFATYPHRGTAHPDLPGNVRHVTDAEFVYYFALDDEKYEVEILAVFFGGRNHLRHFRERPVQH